MEGATAVQQEAGEGTEGSLLAAKLRTRLQGVAYVITAAALEKVIEPVLLEQPLGLS